MPPGFIVHCNPVSLLGLLATWRGDRVMPCASALASSSSGDMQSKIASVQVGSSWAPTSFDNVVVLQNMHGRSAKRPTEAGTPCTAEYLEALRSFLEVLQQRHTRWTAPTQGSAKGSSMQREQ